LYKYIFARFNVGWFLTRCTKHFCILSWLMPPVHVPETLRNLYN